MSYAPKSIADRFVLVTEVGTRDGFQSEKEFIPPATKAELINALIDAGVTSFEATSFVSPRAVPQLADAAQLMGMLQRRPGVRLTGLVPNARGAERAAAAGVDMMACFISASETHCQANLNKSIDAAIADFNEFTPIAKKFGIAVRGAIAKPSVARSRAMCRLPTSSRSPMPTWQAGYDTSVWATPPAWPRRRWSQRWWRRSARAIQARSSPCISTTPAASAWPT